jgi:hypothetical protein
MHGTLDRSNSLTDLAARIARAHEQVVHASLDIPEFLLRKTEGVSERARRNP